MQNIRFDNSTIIQSIIPKFDLMNDRTPHFSKLSSSTIKLLYNCKINFLLTSTTNYLCVLEQLANWGVLNLETKIAILFLEGKIMGLRMRISEK